MNANGLRNLDPNMNMSEEDHMERINKQLKGTLMYHLSW